MGVGARILGRNKTQTRANGGKGPLSRKAPPKHKDVDASPASRLSENPSLAPSNSRSSSSGKEKESSSSLHSDDQHYYARLFSSLSPTSLIPDPLAELPTWFNIDTEAWNPSLVGTFRSRYPMHNPAGPRWYQNAHLLPPTEKDSSQFSASFPPIPTAAERSQESTRLRTPSASPLPTPNSSQLRIVDPNGRVRTRKISQTDNVDMLDGTDPWGQQWHHDSPYDIGGLNRDASPETEEPHSRRMSLNMTGNRHKSVTPSPLSQSTSAVHLHITASMSADPPHRLGKRRKPFVGLFGSQSQDEFHPKHASALQGSLSPLSADSERRQRVLRRRSTAGPPPSSPSALLSADMADKQDKQDKHGSFMGRLARRFSLMRKCEEPEQPVNGIGGDSPVDGISAQFSDEQSKTSLAGTTRAGDPPKRVPPPSIDAGSTAADGAPSSVGHHSSVLDAVDDEAPVPSKLTVINPDEPESPVVASPLDLTGPVSSEPDTESSKADLADISASEPDERMASLDTPVAPPSPIAVVEASLSSPDAPFPTHSVSPPLPELPRPTLAAALDLDHSLPPTPRTERPLSLVTEPSTLTSSSPRTQTQETNFSMSSTNLTAYAPSSVTVSDDPALFRASIVANPPTPHVRPMVIFPSARATQAPVPSPVETSPKHRDGSPTKKDGHHKSSSTTRRRETETYTLVRSPSGNARPIGDVIMGMGEQWEVVQSPSDDGSRKSRKKERSGSREVDSPIREEGEHYHHKRQRSVNDRPAAEQTMSTSSSRATRTPSVDAEQRQHGTVSSRKERRSSSRQRETDADANASVKATVTSHHHPHRHERALSAGARPASDTQLDPLALKAREAWEKDRLWKANSMTYGPDGTPLVSTPPTIGDGSRASTVVSADMQMAGTIPSTSDLHLQRSTTLPPSQATSPPHGSSHTYFTIGPYQGSHTIPAVYVPYPAAVPASQNQSSPPRRRQVSRSFSDRVPFLLDDRKNDPPSLTRNYIGNPLPDPPRISTFQAAPLPPSLVGPLGGASYAGVPTRS